MKTTDNQLTKINTLILGAFVFFFFTKLFHWMPTDVFRNSLSFWAYTDWLIDYSSGFTRRGLSGELLNLTSMFAQPRAIVGLLSWSIFIGVVLGYVRLCTRSINTLSPFLMAAVLFLPSLLPFYLYEHGAFGRKETIGFLIILWHLYLLESYGKAQAIDISNRVVVNSYIKKLLPVTVILLPVHVFIHEASFLLFVPTHLIITYSILRLDLSVNLRQKLFYLILIYLPVILAFSIVFIFGRPSFDVAHAICKKWEISKALEAGACSISGKDTMWALPGSLTGLPWSFSQAASLTFSFSVKNILAWISIFTILGFSTAYSGSRIAISLISDHFNDFTDTAFARYHSKNMIRKYFLLPLIISVPLYIMGWDLGRWFAVSCINFVMISLSRDIHYAQDGVGNVGEAGVRITTKQQSFEESTRSYHIKLFLLLLIVFFIRMPHCCPINMFSLLAEPIQSLALKIVSLI